MGLMSDLKEFGQNFVLTAGDTIAENIKKRDEQYRKDVLDQYATLKANIKKNKAADQKLFNSMLDEAKTLVGLAPNLPEAYLSYGLSSKDNYKQLLKALQEDSERGKSGFFMSEWAAKNNMKPEDIYSPRKRDVSSMVRSLRSPTIKTTKPKSKVSPDTEDTLKSLAGLVFGGSTGPDKVIEAAEAKISGRGRGVFGKSDLDYAYSTPTRGISLPDKTVSLKRVMKGRDKDIMLFKPILDKDIEIAEKLNILTTPTSAGEGVDIDINNPKARQLIAQRDGLDKKLETIYRAFIGTNDMELTNNVIKKQFPITEGMPDSKQQDIRRFRNYLSVNIRSNFADQLKTLPTFINDIAKQLIMQNQSGSGTSSSLLDPATD
tara:strand:+ start:1116 stop:2243 length:1128 start_codon:yes stop_codon:yes gene_type:complete